ncbi:DUF4199 domain-containing protein [Reichenbachiella carrageenanivorans]|uniref:DUF4199 domain-containing protein n=1 Tax=Reichenbachiella carrageenanivorans TaxID=2979869 RepID=A0ABY6D204_9BACT|nr:DUF4199 domain-containing protein [Reichenbachiella carrageenanivorans]UXX79650.1 DUF4199 domain-containing protein [Reichenbachiella carrageenanivorans]
MKPLFKVPLKFGLIGASINIAMYFVLYLTDSNPLMEMRVFDFFIIPIFIFFGIKEFRDIFNQRVMEFWQGMTVGFFIYGTIALLYSIFLWIALEFSDGEILQEYITESLNVIKENKDILTEEMGIDSYQSSFDEVSQTTAIDLALDSLFKKAGIGFLLTSVLSTVLKKQPKNN